MNRQFFLGLCFCFALGVPALLQAQSDSGRFTDHGVISPVSTDRGVVATVDGEGRNVLLAWLFDRRGCYALLMIDVATGKTEQFPVPFNNHRGDSPFASLLSSKDKYYSHFNGFFLEFDPKQRAFTFSKETAPQMGMGMTEDEQGRIWVLTYPNSGVVSYDPQSKTIVDYGYVHKENWAQYQRFIAFDDKGWLYFALGNTATQVVAFHPETKESRPLLDGAERKRGMAYVYPGIDGKVYGQSLQGSAEPWFLFYDGKKSTVDGQPQAKEKPIRTGSQAYKLLTFPDGTQVTRLDLIERVLVTEHPETKSKKEVSFDYSSEGSWIMGVAASPDGRSLFSGGSFPMRQINYFPETDSWERVRALGQFNALGQMGQHLYIGSYPTGHLLQWDPSKPYVPTTKGNKGSNPRMLAIGNPLVYRPYRIFAYPDANTVIMAGGPGYGYTGGGLLLYNVKTDEHTLLTDTAVVLDQSTMGLAPLKNGKILGGTSIGPGTGGERKASEAVMYIMDIATHKIEWKEPVIPKAQNYTDLHARPDGLVYGIADRRTFFVFDPETRRVIHTYKAHEQYGATVAEQSPRVFVRGEGNDIYILFDHHIVQVMPDDFSLKHIAKLPAPMRGGGDYLNGRLYFVCGSRLYSYTL